jgi:hypothetical protein
MVARMKRRALDRLGAVDIVPYTGWWTTGTDFGGDYRGSAIRR